MSARALTQMVGAMQPGKITSISARGDQIPRGTFEGKDEIPPGTFHGGDEIPPGTFHCEFTRA